MRALLSIICSTANLVILMLGHAQIAAAADVRTVAFAGQLAPGTADENRFLYFNNPPVINRKGDVAFDAQLTDESGNSLDNGLWMENADGLQMVVGANQQIVVGGAGPGRIVPSIPWISSTGSTAFSGGFQPSPPGSSSTGIWIASRDTISPVVLSGIQAPGAPPDVSFRTIINGEVFLNAADHVAFSFSVRDEARHGPTFNGIWSTSTGHLGLVALEGAQVPGTLSGTRFDDVRRPVLSNNGSLSFAASIEGVGPQNTLNGIWTGKAGDVDVLVREGWEAPGLGPDVQFFAFDHSLGINGQGATAFRGLVVGDGIDASNDDGIWVGSPGNIQLAARQGDAVPGMPPGVIFTGLSNPILNDEGKLALMGGTLDGAGSKGRGIWSGAINDQQLVVHTDNPVPGAPAKARFDFFEPPVLNATGQLAFLGRLVQTPTGGRGGGVPGNPADYGFVDATNDEGIWATNANGVLQLVVRTGDTLEIAPNDSRVISRLLFAGHSGNGDGRRSSFNDKGQVAFIAGFADGSSGVFVSSAVAIPEPSALDLAAVTGCLTIFWRRRRTGRLE